MKTVRGIWQGVVLFAGWQMGIKAKVNSGKGRLSRQNWYIVLSGNAHLGPRLRSRSSLKAEISTPF